MTRASAITAVLCSSAAVACAVTWVFAWRERGVSGPRPKAPVQEEIERVPAASGELVLADGRKVLVRIARLHAETDRQSFDAAALRERFALSEGEPFQCVVEVQAAANPKDAERGFDLKDARVEDERGVALTSFPAARAALATGIVDPLAALAAPPSTLVPAENRVSFLMWGRAPESGARFASCCERPIALSASDVSSREIQTTLARARRVNASTHEPAVEAR